MLRQISLVLSFLILGVFFSVGVLNAGEAITAIKGSAKDAAVTANETDKEPEAEVPAETAPRGISVNDLEDAVKPETPEPAQAPAGRDKQESSQERALAPDNERAAGNHPAAGSIIVGKDWTVDGKIVGDKERKLIIAAGDTVYLNIGNDRVYKGDICFIYRKIGRVKDPDETGEILGYEVRRIGKIEITDSSSGSASTAKVIVSYEPINIGDSVKIAPTE